MNKPYLSFASSPFRYSRIEQKHEQLNARIHDVFFHEETNQYASSSQIDLIYPMLVGVTPASLLEDVKQFLFAETAGRFNGHIATGLVGISILTRWATQNQEADFVYGMLKKRTYPGYRRFHVRPQMVDGITWVKASKDTPYGLLSVEWKSKGDSFAMSVSVPVGTSALVCLPNGEEVELPSGKHGLNCRL